MIQKVAIQRQRSVEVPEVQYPERTVDVPVATRRQSPVMLQRLLPTIKRVQRIMNSMLFQHI